MGVRGRKSASELALANVVEIVPRPVAPDELSDEEAAEWDAVVSRMPAEWFPRETHGVLAQYCRHVVCARHVAFLVRSVFENGIEDLEQYDKLLKMQEREGRALSSLATRLRLTQQTQHDREKKPKAPSGSSLFQRPKRA